MKHSIPTISLALILMGELYVIGPRPPSRHIRLRSSPHQLGDQGSRLSISTSPSPHLHWTNGILNGVKEFVDPVFNWFRSHQEPHIPDGFSPTPYWVFYMSSRRVSMTASNSNIRGLAKIVGKMKSKLNPGDTWSMWIRRNQALVNGCFKEAHKALENTRLSPTYRVWALGIIATLQIYCPDNAGWQIQRYTDGVGSVWNHKIIVELEAAKGMVWQISYHVSRDIVL